MKKNLMIGIILIYLITGIIAISLFIQNTNKKSEVLDYNLESILNEALQDEYHAEAIYEKVIENFGQVNPYINIIRAEKRHSESIKNLYANHNLEIPKNKWENDEDIPTFNSIQEACQASAQAEIDNIAIYDKLLPTIKEKDIKIVFTNNKNASQNKHLPAFNRCS